MTSLRCNYHIQAKDGFQLLCLYMVSFPKYGHIYCLSAALCTVLWVYGKNFNACMLVWYSSKVIMHSLALFFRVPRCTRLREESIVTRTRLDIVFEFLFLEAFEHACLCRMRLYKSRRLEWHNNMSTPLNYKWVSGCQTSKGNVL